MASGLMTAAKESFSISGGPSRGPPYADVVLTPLS